MISSVCLCQKFCSRNVLFISPSQGGMIKKNQVLVAGVSQREGFSYLIIQLFGGWQFRLLREESNFPKINNSKES